MKKICTILGLALCIGGAAIAVEGGMEKPIQQFAPSEAPPATGSEAIAALRQNYNEGKFKSFLDGLESSYQTLEKSGRFQEFADMRVSTEFDGRLKELADHYEILAKALIQQRNSELQEVCKGEEGEISCKRVQSAILELSPKQQEAMAYLASLRFKTPEQAANDDERKLIEIDLAYEFKFVHLDAQRLSSEIADLQEKQIILEMDKIEKMQNAAKHFSDQKLKEKVDLAAQVFDAWQSKGWDMRLLANASKRPSGDLERKIGSVLSSYKAKKDDLYQREFLAKLDSN